MTPVEVSDICELFVRKDDVSRSRRKVQTPEKQSATQATPRSEAALGLEPDGIKGSTGEDVEATETATPPRLQNELNSVHATGDETKTATADSRGGGRDDNTAEGRDQLMNQDQSTLTVSFAAVSECKAVREWVSRGAYTLPAFDVTSGQRQDIR